MERRRTPQTGQNRADSDDGLLTTQEAARRLGIKQETLYSYVSRGLITRIRAADGKGSLFAPTDIAALAARGARTQAPKGTGPAPIFTELTLVKNDRLYYRGCDATAMAGQWTFEEVAEWLWTGQRSPAAYFTASPASLTAARAAAAALPARARTMDCFKAAVIAASVTDPLCMDLRDVSVAATARSLITVMVTAAPILADHASSGAKEEGRVHPDAAQGIATLLWPRLTSAPASPESLRALEGALVLLADHDIAASTFAARVAASTRAHPYAIVTAGLAALDGPLHGGVGAQARRLINNTMESGDPVGVIAETLREGGRVPGFGHPVYQRRDPRADALLELVERLPDPIGIRPAAAELLDVACHRLGSFPNIDFALALLAQLCMMSADAEEAVFAVARSAGWIAHALEEYQAPGVRHRPRGIYLGPAPSAE